MGLQTWLATKALTGKLPLWMYRLLGKWAAKKLQLEGTMADTPVVDDKPWYKSKAKLAAVIMVVVSAIQPISTAFGHPYQVPLWVIEILTGLGVYGVRDAIKPVQ